MGRNRGVDTPCDCPQLAGELVWRALGAAGPGRSPLNEWRWPSAGSLRHSAQRMATDLAAGIVRLYLARSRRGLRLGRRHRSKLADAPTAPYTRIMFRFSGTAVDILIAIILPVFASASATSAGEPQSRTTIDPSSHLKMAESTQTRTLAVFSVSTSSGAAPLTVKFLIRPPSASYTSYYVDFGDGQAATPSILSSRPLLYATQHTYAAQGAYTAVAGAQACSPSGEKCAPIIFSDLKISVTGRN